MAVSVKELIEQKELLTERKKALFDIKTSVGVITVKKPSRALAAETIDMEDGDSYIVMECTVEPNLKDPGLLKAFDCLEPTDLPEKIFESGEVTAIARKIMEHAHYRKDVVSEVHETVKN